MGAIGAETGVATIYRQSNIRQAFLATAFPGKI